MYKQFETPKRICVAAPTDYPLDYPKVSIEQHWSLTIKHMSFNFKSIIEDYCGTGRLSEEEVDFLER